MVATLLAACTVIMHSSSALPLDAKPPAFEGASYARWLVRCGAPRRAAHASVVTVTCAWEWRRCCRPRVSIVLAKNSLAPRRPTVVAARWQVNQATWGTIATVSNGHDSGSVGTPFANPQSFSDGPV